MLLAVAEPDDDVDPGARQTLVDRALAGEVGQALEQRDDDGRLVARPLEHRRLDRVRDRDQRALRRRPRDVGCVDDLVLRSRCDHL